MRIISGRYKGKIILNPIDKITRPLKDMVKESIFNIFEHSRNETVEFDDNVILDLFSGSGSFGIECLSRGAKKVYFCENYKNSIKVLNKNLKNLKLNYNSKVIQKNAYEISKKDIENNKVNLIYLDPPFRDRNVNDLLNLIKNSKIANKDTLIVIHRNKKTKDKFNKYFKISREETYGVSKIIFGKILFQ
ncbi:SAM-dependent methyltransferase [Pelagibacteraceae bacterium GOM-A4]|nr:SAM-dependent methyltransferase [Pelagibacteraceae bacterium GOM-A4]